MYLDEMGGDMREPIDYEAEGTEARADALLSRVKHLEEEVRDLRLVNVIAVDMVRLLSDPQKEQVGDHYASHADDDGNPNVRDLVRALLRTRKSG
jgi:hypothetical protein